MGNNISITVRLPHELNTQLKSVSKEIGVTKTNLIRSAIHDFLTEDNNDINVSSDYTGNSDRLVLNVNSLTYGILDNACKKYNKSMNAIIISVSILALERSTKWLQSTQL